MKIEDFTCEFERYPAYKDSGVDWLGEIPEGWEVKRIKYLFKEINERSENGNEELLSVSQYTGVTKKSNKVSEGELLTNAASLEGYKKVYKNDLVSNIMLAWNGSMGFSPYSGITSPAYSIYRLLENNDERYFHYLLRTEMYKAEFKRNSSGVIESRLRLYTEDFFRIYSLVPSIQEQISISNFLDDKCNKIDKLIAQKEKMISLLEERKKILIQNAVTKGLNPDVKMKDSGVEWIGEIPEHWEVKRLASFGSFSKGGGFSKSDLINRGENAILYGDIYTKYDIEIEKVYRKISKKKSEKAVKIIKSDILFTGSGETIEDIGKTVYYNNIQDAYAGGDIIIFRQENYESSYLTNVLNIEAIKYEKSRNARGEIIVHTYASKLKKIKIPIPPKDERTIIDSHIDKVANKINKAISIQRRQIVKFRDYKTILINASVTGKIKI